MSSISQINKQLNKDNYIPFKNKFSLEKRTEEAKRIRQKFPDRVPVIVERAHNSDLPLIDKNKYLVPHDLSVSQFLYVIRRRIKLKADQALFLFINQNDKYILPPSNALMSQILKEFSDRSGFVSMNYHTEDTFGQ